MNWDKRGLAYKRQVSVPITYDGITFNEGLRLDVLVEGRVICELKTVENLDDVHQGTTAITNEINR